MTTWLPSPKIARPADGGAWRVRRCALGLVSLVCLSTSASSTCPTPATLRLCLVNHTLAPDQSLATARLEADAIWASVDLALAWCQRDAVTDPAGRPAVTVILREALPLGRAPAPRPGPPSGDPLAWTLFDGDKPTGVIEVSLSAVAAVVMRESIAGKRMIDLPQNWRHRLLGRALGRVIAHEIGHWLWGASHARDGLMRAGFTGSALVAMQAPALPDVSIGQSAMQRLIGDARGVTPVSPD